MGNPEQINQTEVGIEFFEKQELQPETDIENKFFEKRSPSFYSLYTLFTKSEKEFFNDPELNDRLREMFFQNTAGTYKLVEELLRDKMTGMFRAEQMYRYAEILLKDKNDLDSISDVPLTIAAADFAGLGYFNEQSHLAGNTALTRASREIRDELDSEKSLGFRSGGDEFTFVFKKQLGESQKIGEEIRQKLLAVDTHKIGDYKFELPLRIDIGYADIREGVHLYREICEHIQGDRMCEVGRMKSSIIELTYQIADMRSMMRKNTSLIRFLIETYKQNPELEKFQKIFGYATKKKTISFEELMDLANIQSVTDQMNAINQKGYAMSQQEIKQEEENASIKREMIKRIAEAGIKSIL